MNVGIFTDCDLETVSGVTTTLTAALGRAPAGMRLRVYTTSALPVAAPGYLAVQPVGSAVPLLGTRLELPRVASFLDEARADQLDVAHLMTSGPVALAGLFVAWRLGLPVVGTVDPRVLAAPAAAAAARLATLGRRVSRRLYRRCARLFVPSQRVRRLLVQEGEDARRIALWRRGVDVTVFTPAKRSAALREHWHVSTRRPAIVYAGRLSWEKGVALLPRLSDRLHAGGVEHRLIIIGDGPARSWLRDSVPDAVCTGRLPRDHVAEALASADLLVFPSDEESGGSVVLEAQASGVPVIVGGGTGVRENLISGRTGGICYTRDDGDWADAIAAILRGGGLAAMRGHARQYALARQWERAFDPLFRAYREVHAEHQAARSRLVPLPAGSVPDAKL